MFSLNLTLIVGIEFKVLYLKKRLDELKLIQKKLSYLYLKYFPTPYLKKIIKNDLKRLILLNIPLFDFLKPKKLFQYKDLPILFIAGLVMFPIKKLNYCTIIKMVAKIRMNAKLSIKANPKAV